jgi:aspartate/methionine/tyrosine aminotransferase
MASVETSERLERLGDNPFAKLHRLLADIPPNPDLPILNLSIGEPQHAPPRILAETIAAHADLWNRYPPVEGTPEFRATVARWLTRRYDLPVTLIDPMRHVLALCGTKEGLYLAAQMAVPERKAGQIPAVLLPNPFYQVYIGAGAMAGAELIPMPARTASGFLPDFDALSAEILERTAFAFFCTPTNPQGAIASLDLLKRAILLAREYDFVLAVDECYSEIYDRDKPPGALQAAAELGGDLDNLLVFHSLSKRSNAAGLRAGFVAGDARLISRLRMLRAYGAAQMSLPIQHAAIALWQDEAHVVVNRAAYRAKIDTAERVLRARYGFYRPQGGFFLWLDVGDGVAATERLWREASVRALPGAYLSLPDAHGDNPGNAYLRLALVHDDQTVSDALNRFSKVL